MLKIRALNRLSPQNGQTLEGPIAPKSPMASQIAYREALIFQAGDRRTP